MSLVPTIPRQTSAIKHPLSIINHQSSIIRSSIINHHSSLIKHQSSTINHQSSIIHNPHGAVHPLCSPKDRQVSCTLSAPCQRQNEIKQIEMKRHEMAWRDLNWHPHQGENVGTIERSATGRIGVALSKCVGSPRE
jgi:hypothetical protein